jgi:hypothetical protein
MSKQELVDVKLKYQPYGPDGTERLYTLYFPFKCEGVSRNGPDNARCYKRDCQKPVEVIGYTTLEEQERAWIREDEIEEEKNKQRQNCVLYIK